jgi:hypothetical protein
MGSRVLHSTHWIPAQTSCLDPTMLSFMEPLESLKGMRTIVDGLNNAPLKQGLLDLQGQLLTLQVQVLEQQVEMAALVAEVTRLRDYRDIDRKLSREYDAYVLVESAKDRRGPFCMHCWNRKQLLQPLVEAGAGVGYCPSCKETFRTGETSDRDITLDTGAARNTAVI